MVGLAAIIFLHEKLQVFAAFRIKYLIFFREGE